MTVSNQPQQLRRTIAPYTGQIVILSLVMLGALLVSIQRGVWGLILSVLVVGWPLFAVLVYIGRKYRIYWTEDDVRQQASGGADLCIKYVEIARIASETFQLRRYAATRPNDAFTGVSLLAFHIAELQRRRDLLRSVWRWIVVPIMISLWVIVEGFAQARPGSAGTLLIFACVMTVIALVLTLANIRGARRLQRDMEALHRLGT